MKTVTKYISEGNFNEYRLSKVLSIFGAILINIILIILLRTPPSSCYEFSIYNMYPPYFWYCIIASVFIGQLILLINAFYQSKNNTWIFGLLIILLADSILLFMPLIRGYFIYGMGDGTTHIGYMNDIQNTSNIGQDYYPINHILGFTMSVIANFKFASISMIIPPIFSLFFIISYYVLCNDIFEEKSEILLSMVFSSILLFGNLHLLFSPFTQSFLLMPFICYVFLKANRSKNKSVFTFILIILCIFTVLSHPLLTIFLIITFLLFKFSSHIYTKLIGYSTLQIKVNSIILIMTAIFTMWSVYLYLFISLIKSKIDSINGGNNADSEFKTYFNIISKIDVSPYYLLETVINKFGAYILLGLISSVCVLIIYLLVKDNRNKVKYYHIFSTIGFILFFVLSAISLFINPYFNFDRVYAYSILFSFILIPSSLQLLFKHIRSKQTTRFMPILKPILCLILISLLYLSLFNLFFSPINKQPNLQISQGEFYGMEKFYKIRNDSLNLLEYGIVNFRYINAIYGVYSVNKDFNYPLTSLPVDHFGYTNNSSISQSYNDSLYFILTDKGRGFYPNIYPEFKTEWRFNDNDFNRLEHDYGISNIYTNGHLYTYIINAS